MRKPVPYRGMLVSAALCLGMAAAGCAALALDEASRPGSSTVEASAVAEPSLAGSPTPSVPTVLPSASQISQSASAQATQKPVARATGQTTKPVVKSTVTTKTPAKPKTYRLSPVTAYGSQAAVDQCKLVLWMLKGYNGPTTLIAGHNNCGYAWLDDMPTGSIVIVTSGPGAGKYKIVGHRWQSQKGGRNPSWLSSYAAVFQTCTTNGMGFSLAVKA